MCTERISWQPELGHEEQEHGLTREVTELQGCHQRAPLLQAQEEFGDPEKKEAEEMEHLWACSGQSGRDCGALHPRWSHLKI